MKRPGVRAQKADAKRADAKKLNNKHVSLPILVCSFVFAFAAGIFMGCINADQPGEVVFWNAFFFLLVFLGGYLGMTLGAKLSRKYQINRPKFHAGRFVVVALLIFLVAGVGQLLFEIEEQTEEISTVTKTTYREADAVLLLDASGSMSKSNYVQARTEAAAEFVESLDENIRLQAVSFTGDGIPPDKTELLVMNEVGKAEIKEFIADVGSYGLTEFEDALETALDTLDNDEDRAKIVIIVTDGGDTLVGNTKQKFLDSGIPLFSIRTTKDPDDTQGQNLAQYAVDTGGADFVVELDEDGNMNVSELTAAFEEAISLVKEETFVETVTKLGLSEDCLLGTEETTLYQFLIRLITIFVCAVLFEIGYFGQFSFSKLLRSLILAAVMSGLITIFSAMAAGFFLVVLCLGTSYVTLRVQDAPQDP